VNYAERIASTLNVRPGQVAATVDLLDAGNTLPFVARYRKEATGGLDEEQLRRVAELLGSLRALDERREAVITAIHEQGKLTPELRARLLAAESRAEIEDLYLPFKQKRRTRASVARERGLEPLARVVLEQARMPRTARDVAAGFLSDEVPTVEDALAGARDIVAETVSEDSVVRRRTREKAFSWGTLRCAKVASAEDPRSVYELYYDYECRVDRLRPHQVLAINRGEEEKVLRVRLDVPERDWRQAIDASYRPDARSPFAEHLALACEDGAKRLLLPAVERDVRAELGARAELHAIEVFAENLRGLLAQPPLAGHTVLGIDPGLRTGCKVAVVDPTGKVLETATIYPHAPQNHWDTAMKMLVAIAARRRVTLVAIGNGTASRETERLAAELIRAAPAPAGGDPLRYLTVSEAGASVYSASPLARAELPSLDVTLRGAVSIARRVQDPLAELVKIEPKAIGVGMYQHDVDQTRLEASLAGVVESVVNRVGVDLNTASPALLTHVAGIGPKLAERIVAYRDEHGAFRSRAALRRVSGLGPKAFEQSAGFLRVRDGEEPLDASAIHPESYTAAASLLRRAGTSMTNAAAERESALARVTSAKPLPEIAREIGVGLPTLEDILEQLVRPGRDPRADLPTPILRSDVLSMDDLKPGMVLAGTVRNVVDFGAFVDIGVKQDGLLHRSQWPRGAAPTVGDVIEVSIVKVEKERGRIALGAVVGGQ
jgi:protein Tex